MNSSQPTEMPSFAPRLEPNCLYIATQTMPTAGFQTFHWTIITVDSDGRTTWHQWASPNGLAGTIPIVPGVAEQYIRLSSISSSAFTRNPSVLAYFRVKGYYAPSSGDARSRYEAAFQEVFSSSYATVRENRARGITCRTWALRVLNALQRSAIIRRNDDVTVQDATIKGTSAEQEEILMKMMMNGNRFTAPIFDI